MGLSFRRAIHWWDNLSEVINPSIPLTDYLATGSPTLGPCPTGDISVDSAVEPLQFFESNQTRYLHILQPTTYI